MLANQEIMQAMQAPKTKRSTRLLTERSVNIYSDLGDPVRERDNITITGDLIGFNSEHITVQRQFDNGFNWVDVPGANKLTHAFVATAETVNYSWRLSVTTDD